MYSLHPTEANVASLLRKCYNNNLYVFCLCVQYMAVNIAVGTMHFYSRLHAAYDA